MIQEGSVFRLRGSESSPHYHVVVFRDPLGHDKVNIVLYITSSKSVPDTTCEFNDKDDFFIDRYSWVKYRNCKVLSDIDLAKLECLGIASPATLEKLRVGFLKALSQGKIIDEAKSLFQKWETDWLYSQIK